MIEPLLPQTSKSKLNLYERPAVQALISPTLLCVNLIWTVSLLYLTWSMFLTSNSNSLTRSQNGQALRHNVLNVPGHSSYSAMLEQERVANTIKTMNGRLRDNSTIYRQLPSPQVDQAWAEAWSWYETTFNVTSDELRQAGFDPAAVVVWKEGEDAYPASFEYTHLIHCLDAVRKEMFHEHYFPATINQDPEQSQMRQQHAMHCVHMLLQDLTCHVDLNLIPLVWMPYYYGDAGKRYAPTGMFSTTKTCRNIDAVNQWLRDNHVPGATAMLGDLKPPPNAKILTDDGYWAGP